MTWLFSNQGQIDDAKKAGYTVQNLNTESAHVRGPNWVLKNPEGVIIGHGWHEMDAWAKLSAYLHTKREKWTPNSPTVRYRIEFAPGGDGRIFAEHFGEYAQDYDSWVMDKLIYMDAAETALLVSTVEEMIRNMLQRREAAKASPMPVKADIRFTPEVTPDNLVFIKPDEIDPLVTTERIGIWMKELRQHKVTVTERVAMMAAGYHLTEMNGYFCVMTPKQLADAEVGPVTLPMFPDINEAWSNAFVDYSLNHVMSPQFHDFLDFYRHTDSTPDHK